MSDRDGIDDLRRRNCTPRSRQTRTARATVRHLGVAEDLSGRGTSVENECVSESRVRFPPIPNRRQPVSHYCVAEQRTHNPLFLPVSNSDDTFALAVPLEIVARIIREVIEQKESRPHIFPEITLYSPLSD